MGPVHRGDVRHAAPVGVSALRGGLGPGQGFARAPPGLPPRGRRSQEVPAGLAAAALAGLRVEVPLLHQPGVLEREAVAEGAAVRELPVGAGRVALGARPVRGVRERRGGRVRQRAAAPLAFAIRLRSFRGEAGALKPRGREQNIKKKAPRSESILPVTLGSSARLGSPGPHQPRQSRYREENPFDRWKKEIKLVTNTG